MIINFSEFVLEKYSEDEDIYKVYDVYYEEYRDQLARLIKDIVDKNLKRQPWRTAPFGRIKKIWNDWAKLNFIRDEKGMNMIADIVVANIVKLDMNTMLAGHTQDNPERLLGDYDYNFKAETEEEEPEFKDPNQTYLFAEYEEEMKRRDTEFDKKKEEKEYELPITFEEFDERLDDYLWDDNWGQHRISDYALKPLMKVASDLILAKTSVEKLILCDKAFNIVHPRGDIASLFVKGGSSALSELSGENLEFAEKEVHTTF